MDFRSGSGWGKNSLVNELHENTRTSPQLLLMEAKSSEGAADWVNLAQ